MIAPSLLSAKFAIARPFASYVATGTPEQQEKWNAIHQRVTLTPRQTQLCGSFIRRMPVLVSSGLWCGDCAHQCPMLARIGEASTVIDVRFLNRDEHMDLAEQVKICGGFRVPTVIFMAEDFEFMSVLGDKTLSRLRAKAAKSLGASCPLPGADLPADELAATTEEWLNECERVQLLLRLSTRLRELHHD
ncbi:MAG: thioredoxin family protein [Planctomycetota bacterium]|nr:thioredoxin family protein [Planctomycetota bacterium]